ncbi:MAG: DUF418 domain-containing protein [Saprospiraceae bacterium]|nr:DUF418 domain-containing protein [Saprospiraceae bacterium]
MDKFISPVSSNQRILSLDILRGFAICGILLINIQSFAMPGAAYLNPMAYGDMSGLNGWIWKLSYILGDSKFMAIFSMLYGAGIVLVTRKAENRSGKSAGLHYRRTFWLLIIGLIHAHIIWAGDILVAYAICALFVFLFRNMKARTLLVIGILLISVHTLLYTFLGTSLENWPPDQLEAASADWKPGQDALNEEIAALTGSWGEQIAHNSASAVFMETIVFLFLFLWRASGLMLVGMALYKWGVLTAEKSAEFYKKGLVLGWLIGFPIVIYGVYKQYDADWSYEYSMFLGSQWNYWGSLGVSFGYICMIMLLAKSDIMKWIKDRLAAVGQMALTNYIMQSVICTLIFYGIGFGLFGQFERWLQFLVVASIWIVQLLWSRPWLNNYRFGPLEWIWRSMTYMKRQPMKK